MSTTRTSTCDVLISGAGLTGATLACALGGSGLRVALVDKAEVPVPARHQGDYALRVSAINRAAENVLRNLGVWPHITTVRAHAFQTVVACHEHGDGQVVFDANELGETHLGHIIENDVIVRCLLQRITAHDNIDMHSDHVVGLAQENDFAEVHLASDTKVRARLVVACDGAWSALRNMCGADVRSGDYHQRCIVGNIRFTGDHQRVAWQRFLSTGPLGLLPLEHGCCSIAWSCVNARAHALLAMDDTAFIAALAKAIGGRLGTITALSARRSFPLSHLHAKRYINGRTVLTGDAAHVVHPLAGLGANLGIMDAAALTAVLLRAHKENRDIGCHAMLRRYERWRQAENAVVLNVLHGFNALFTRDAGKVGGHPGHQAQHSRGGECAGDESDECEGTGGENRSEDESDAQSKIAGDFLGLAVDGALCVANHITPAKNLLARLASGLGGDLPNLARPMPHDLAPRHHY